MVAVARTARSKKQRQVVHPQVLDGLRAIKRLVWPMLGFKSFRSAAVTLAGVELMHMIRKGQQLPTGEMRPARQFYSLAG
ncbi:MAG: putative transposase [Acetobacteraceae bacterium]|jgi:transposase-like protein|nr:putative transposase [Acetobacteraceae bacterium]